MTQNTSSPSAKDTPKTDDALAASGIPRESIDPLCVYTCYEEMLQATKMKEVSWSDRRYLVWDVWGRVKHVFGIHTYVLQEDWDVTRGSIKIIGSICWHCNKRL